MTQATERTDPHQILLDLALRARSATSQQELAFMLVNDSHALAPYRQAALQLGGKPTLSGVLQAQANAPYALWLKELIAHLQGRASQALQAADLPAALADQWAQWWPAHALWLPLGDEGGWLLARESAWSESEAARLRHWSDAWLHAHAALERRRWWSGQSTKRRGGRRWGWPVALLALAAAMAYPVPMSVLAPGELVPANPLIIRAPMEGVVDVFHVQPNQTVRKGQPLFGFDEALIQSRLDVARQGWVTAQTDYRQTSQQALVDARARNQLPLLMGKIEEKRAEVQYLSEQLRRARVVAPQDGVVLMDDPSEWIGRPVTVGERILRLSAEGDVEVEAWLPLADAIGLKAGDELQLYLQASPLAPLKAKLRYMAHEAVDRPEGHQAFRLRATLSQNTTERVGQKGTAKIYGDTVPLVYWMFRRPLASVRLYLGI